MLGRHCMGITLRGEIHRTTPGRRFVRGKPSECTLLAPSARSSSNASNDPLRLGVVALDDEDAGQGRRPREPEARFNQRKSSRASTS